MVRKPSWYYFLKLSNFDAIIAQHEPNLQTFVKPVSERFVKYINLRGYFMKWYLHIMKSILLAWLLCWFQHNKQSISARPLVAHPNFIIDLVLATSFTYLLCFFCERCRQLCVTLTPTSTKISNFSLINMHINKISNFLIIVLKLHTITFHYF